jgi:hypothetical protein
VPRPGVDVEVVDEVTEQGAVLNTGQGFFVGPTERGDDLGIANSLGDFKKKWGDDRSVDAEFYDGVSSFFTEGGGTAIISRDVPNDASVAAAEFGAASGIMVDAKSGGLWGNEVDVTAHYASGSDAAGEPVYLTVTYQGEEVERSPTLRDLNSMVAWGLNKSNYVSFNPTDPEAPLPADGVVAALAAGTAGAGSSAAFQSALDRMSYDLGPGQVMSPGQDDPEYHLMIGAHLEANHRCGIIDLPDTGDAAALSAAREELDGAPGARSILAMGSHLIYPFETSPASIVVPYSGVQAGIIARVDKLGDVAAVAAGANGISNRALGLSQSFTDADRESLNANGVTLGRQLYGLVRTYGYRTAAGPDLRDNWTFFQESRVIMAIAHEANAGLEEYVFDTIDGLYHVFVQVKNMLTGICLNYWRAGALFGAESSQSFKVVCDSTNNPIDTIKLGEIHATIYLRTSKVAEWIKLNIIKVPTEREV